MQAAEQAAQKAIELGPKYEPAHANLITILDRLNKLTEAIECIKLAKKLSYRCEVRSDQEVSIIIWSVHLCGHSLFNFILSYC